MTGGGEHEDVIERERDREGEREREEVSFLFFFGTRGGFFSVFSLNSSRHACIHVD